jgi:hypothetical protein
LGQPIGPKTTVTNYQSTLRNIPEQERPPVGVYFSRSVAEHGQIYVVITQGRSQENVKVNAQDTYYEERVLPDDGTLIKNVVIKDLLKNQS